MVTYLAETVQIEIIGAEIGSVHSVTVTEIKPPVLTCEMKSVLFKERKRQSHPKFQPNPKGFRR